NNQQTSSSSLLSQPLQLTSDCTNSNNQLTFHSHFLSSCVFNRLSNNIFIIFCKSRDGHQRTLTLGSSFEPSITLGVSSRKSAGTRHQSFDHSQKPLNVPSFQALGEASSKRCSQNQHPAAFGLNGTFLQITLFRVIGLFHSPLVNSSTTF